MRRKTRTSMLGAAALLIAAAVAWQHNASDQPLPPADFANAPTLDSFGRADGAMQPAHDERDEQQRLAPAAWQDEQAPLRRKL